MCKSTIITFILSLFLCSCSGHDNDRKQAYNTMHSALAKRHDGKTFITDENFDEAVRFFETANDTVAMLNMYQLAAIKMRQLGRQDSSAIFLNKAIGIATPFSNPSTTELYIELSNLYASPTLRKNYPLAIAYAKQALYEASSDDARARTLHDIGLFYSFLNENDSSVTYMQRALDVTTPDNPEYTTYALNFANNPSAGFESSITYLDRINGESLGKLITLGFIYLNKTDLDSAKHYLNASKNLYEGNPSKYSINTYNNLMLLDRSINFIETGKILPSEGTVNDSISELVSVKNKVSEERREHNANLQMQLLQSKARRQIIMSIGLSILLILAIGFGGYVWYSRNKFMRLKKRMDSIKVEQIVVDANKEDSATGIDSNLIRKRIDICVEQFRATKLQGEFNRMELQYRNTGSYPSVKNREAIQKSLIGCFADFIVDLKMTGVKLNIEDIVTCIMSILKETNATTAACLGCTDTAIRTRKTRLRAKLPTDMLALLNL